MLHRASPDFRRFRIIEDSFKDDINSFKMAPTRPLQLNLLQSYAYLFHDLFKITIHMYVCVYFTNQIEFSFGTFFLLVASIECHLPKLICSTYMRKLPHDRISDPHLLRSILHILFIEEMTSVQDMLSLSQIIFLTRVI